jgi:hypothetical protein
VLDAAAEQLDSAIDVTVVVASSTNAACTS